MNLGKVKTFLIVLFLGINVYLLISLFTSSTFYIDNETIESTVEVLKTNKIEVDKDLIMKSVENLKNIDTNNVLYTESFKKNNKNGAFEIKDDVFSGQKNFGNLYAKNDGNIKDTIKEYLEESGFSTEYMKTGEIFKNEKGEKVFFINCYVDDYEVFDSKIKVTVQKNNNVLIKGSWYEPLSDDVKLRTRSRDTVYITSVLVSMIQNEEIMKNAPFRIKDIDYGYLAGASYGEGTHVKSSALPYYRIKDDKGNVYYYDAQNGSYLK